MTQPQRYSFFLLIQATEAWLRLPREERRRMSAEHVGSALARRTQLSLRHFDAEAFSSFCSDVMMIETIDVVAYYDFMEMLRDSPIITTPYFRIVQIVPAIEEGFQAFEARAS